MRGWVFVRCCEMKSTYEIEDCDLFFSIRNEVNLGGESRLIFPRIGPSNLEEHKSTIIFTC